VSPWLTDCPLNADLARVGVGIHAVAVAMNDIAIARFVRTNSTVPSPVRAGGAGRGSKDLATLVERAGQSGTKTHRKSL
jgi:hypothetical protein